MDDLRRLTNPKLQIRGQIERNDTYGDESATGNSTFFSWFGDMMRLIICNHRRKQWHMNSVSAKTSVSTQPPTMKPMVVEVIKKSPQELNFAWLSSNVVTDTYKVLLVFSRRDDQQSEILGDVARKLGWSVSEARNAEEAEELFSSVCHDLVIIDRRGAARSQDADEICRSLNQIKHTKTCTIVALVKKSYFTAPYKEESAILHLLNIGYDRALMECSHEGILMNEFIGIYASVSQPKSHLVAAQLLYTAVDRCRDIVHVTNDQHIIQFANRASEKVLGYKQEELLGKRIEEFVTNENFVLMDQQLQKGREFEGNVNWQKKSKGILNISCRIVPLNIPSGGNQYYLYLYDSISNFQTVMSRPSFHYFTPRESMHSLGRRSFEIRPTHKPRRSTMTKLLDLPFESSITKIITYLTNAMSNADDPEVYSQIQMAIDLLKTTELYTPNIREDDRVVITDPETSDLVGALMSMPSNDPRKSTSTSLKRHSAILNMLSSNHHTQSSKILKNPGTSQELADLLDSCFEWNFNIFKLEVLSNKRPLFYLGMALMSHYRVTERLQCDEQTLQNWLTIIEANYNGHVSYHNSTHATDVLQAIARFMRSDRLQMILDPLDEVAALLAAVTHDIGHPGKSSQFLCNADNKLAILYNDVSVLESHHAALTFKVTLSDDNVNIFKNLNRDVYKSMRYNIIDMILATEMTKHFEYLARFVNVCSNRIDAPDSEAFSDEVGDATTFLLPENVTLIKGMMIKCADVSNPTRPLRLYVEWTRRIAEEYFNQTDEEKKRLLPVVMPMFDRATCSIPKSQIGFLDYIINDMMEAWDAFIDMPEIIGNMRENYKKWKEYYEQGITTLEDIKKLQETSELQLYEKTLSD